MNEVSRWTQRYYEFKVEDRLRTELWQEHWDNGVTYACALGAFLDVQAGLDENGIYHEADEEAREKGCAVDRMPEWLVNWTPAFFDFDSYAAPDYHITWADALYLPGGCIDRANKLPRAKRVALYKKAHEEIRTRWQCHTGYNELYRVLHMSSAPDHVAGTIPAVLDELLTAAGV